MTSCDFASSFSPVPVHALGIHRAVFSIGRLMVFREKLFVSSCQMGMGASTCCLVTIQSLSWSGPAHAVAGVSARKRASAAVLTRRRYDIRVPFLAML